MKSVRKSKTGLMSNWKNKMFNTKHYPIHFSITVVFSTLLLSSNVMVFAETTFVDSFDVSSQETNPQDLAFNSDGTKMFVVGDVSDDVHEYTLSAAFDVSTATFVDSFDVSSQEAVPAGLAFNSDGTKMFVVGYGGDDINEYACTTGFDVSTCSFTVKTGNPFSVSGQDTQPASIVFNSDGTKMFVTGYSSDSVHQYTLSTGYDISTASYDGAGESFDVSSKELTPTDMTFSADGTKMFVIGTAGDDVNQYSLSTAFDVSSATFEDEFSVSAQDGVPTGIAFSSDGLKMFILGYTGDEVHEYTLEVAFDLFAEPTVESTSNSGGGGCADCTPPTLGVNSDGTRLVENGFAYNGDAIDVESFYTPFDLLTVEIGRENIVELKIYENSGADSIQHIGLSFGLDRGQIFGEGLAIIEWDKVYGEDPKITVTDPENVLDNVRVVADPNLVKCTDDSITEQCMKFRIYHSFREGPDFRIFSTYIWDDERNGWQNYFNHGLNVVGESLNPPDVHTVFDRQGYLYTITVTGDRQAVDGNGDRWYLDDDEFWKKEFFVKRPPVQGVPMAGYDKDHPYFTAYQDGQVILAENTLKAILGVDSIQSVLPDYTPGVVSTNDDSKLDKEMTDKMKLEEIKAFEKMYANYYNSGQHDGRFAFTEPSSESGFGGAIVIQNDNSQELMGVVGLMVGLIAVSVMVGFYSIRK